MSCTNWGSERSGLGRTSPARARVSGTYARAGRLGAMDTRRVDRVIRWAYIVVLVLLAIGAGRILLRMARDAGWWPGG